LDEIVASWHPPKTLNFQIPASNLYKHKNRLPHNNYLMYWFGQSSPNGQIKGGCNWRRAQRGAFRGVHALNTYWAHVRRLESRHAAISTQVYPNRAQEVMKECLPTRRWPTTELHKQCACARSLAQRATPTAPSRGTCGTAYPDRARPASAVEPETGNTPPPPTARTIISPDNTRVLVLWILSR